MKKRTDAEHAEHVAYLQGLTRSELSAYCSGVLRAYIDRAPIVEDAVREALPTVVEISAGRRVRRPIICRRCGHEVPREARRGRPRTVHLVCPGSVAAAAA